MTTTAPERPLGSGAILCVFARAPVLGRVKTRLAAEIGEAAALAAHIHLVHDSLERLARVGDGVVTELWIDGVGDLQATSWADRYGLALRAQQGAGLGERMHHALADCHRRGSLGLVVGTDCPGIDAGYVRAAAAALDEHDVVLGPAADGGYGLIGTRRPFVELFDRIPWGTDVVLAATLAQAATAQRSVACLEEIWDVDSAADWRRYLALPTR